MRVVPLVVIVLAFLIGGCATTTVREREASAVAKMSIGGPLVVGGTLGGAAVATTAIVFSASPDLSFDAYALPFAIGGGFALVELVVGGYLMATGYDDFLRAGQTLAEREAIDDRARRLREEAERERRELDRAKPKRDDSPSFDPPL